MEKTSEPGRTRWHILLGRLLKELLEPLDITVYTEFSVMAGPPRADILLIRKKHREWTPEQLRFLPDGIRDSSAEHILIEFKYTESVTKETFRQILGYETFYRQSRNLAEEDVQSFVLSSKTPDATVLKDIGYLPTEKKGVQRHDFWMLEAIPLLCLNELADEPHNAFVKFFASRKKEKIAAFSTLKNPEWKTLRLQVQWLVEGLICHFFSKKGELHMETAELTPEKVMEMGKMWADLILSGMSVEERLRGLGPEEILSRYKPEEVLSRYKAEDRLKGLSAEEIEAYLRKIRKNN